MTKHKNIKFILISSIIAVLVMFFVEQKLEIPYVLTTPIKVFIFILLPVLFTKYNNKGGLDFLPSFKALTKDDTKKIIAFGTFTFVVVLGSYFLLSSYINLDNISNELLEIGVTPLNFIFVAIYITFGNSFIEEYFFRGYIFANLTKEGWKKRAYVISSILFALYHIGIFLTWFSYKISFIALFGLFFGGIIFNWLNSKSGKITNSWLVHMIADVSVMVVGLILFNFI